MQVVELGGNRYEVHSDTSSKTYFVGPENGVLVCNCAFGSVSRNRVVGTGKAPKACKHLAEVQSRYGSKAALQKTVNLIDELLDGATVTDKPWFVIIEPFTACRLVGPFEAKEEADDFASRTRGSCIAVQPEDAP